jgi:CRISPR-associated protein Csd1
MSSGQPSSAETADLGFGTPRDLGLMVTGEMVPVERLHPAIKGVRGAQSTGSSIVSFNLDAFSSYGREQGDNAPVSEAAAFAYTTVLNRFLKRDSRHCVQVGDASTVFWAEASDPAAAGDAEDFFAALVEAGDEEITNQSVKAALEKIRAGCATADIIADLPKGVRFYILGLAPNAARLSIRFYLEDELGVIARRWLEHVERLRIEPSPSGPAPSMWRMLIETAALRKSKNIQPNLAGNWMRAILTGAPYPLTLLSALVIRIRADHDINALRAGMLKSIPQSCCVIPQPHLGSRLNATKINPGSACTLCGLGGLGCRGMGIADRAALFFRATLDRGVMRVLPPNSREIRR